MSDFMQWLYAHYIQPELEAAPKERYELLARFICLGNRRKQNPLTL